MAGMFIPAQVQRPIPQRLRDFGYQTLENLSLNRPTENLEWAETVSPSGTSGMGRLANPYGTASYAMSSTCATWHKWNIRWHP
jgi:hypothetical protein